MATALEFFSAVRQRLIAERGAGGTSTITGNTFPRLFAHDLIYLPAAVAAQMIEELEANAYQDRDARGRYVFSQPWHSAVADAVTGGTSLTAAADPAAVAFPGRPVLYGRTIEDWILRGQPVAGDPMARTLGAQRYHFWPPLTTGGTAVDWPTGRAILRGWNDLAATIGQIGAAWGAGQIELTPTQAQAVWSAWYRLCAAITIPTFVLGTSQMAELEGKAKAVAVNAAGAAKDAIAFSAETMGEAVGIALEKGLGGIMTTIGVVGIGAIVGYLLLKKEGVL